MKTSSVQIIELPVNVGKDIINFKKLVDLKKSPGYVVRERQVGTWFFTGFGTRDGVFYLQGPYNGGINLKQVLSLPREQALAYLERLVSACETLIEHSEKPFELQLDSVYFLKDGSVLLLPADIVKKVREFNPESYRFEVFAPCNNPYLQDQRGKISFSIGCLFHYCATGSFPFPGATVEEINSRIRAFSPVSPVLARPELKPELVDFFKNFFSDQLMFNLSLPDWKQLLHKYRDEGITRGISTEEKAEILARAGSRAEKSNKRFRTHVFFERQGKTILLASLIVIAVSVLLGYYISGFFKPRLTKGFSPEQVVEAFYQGINQLNPNLVRDCVVDNAGKPESDQVNRLFVFTRQEYSLGFNKYISATTWDKRGRPFIAVGQFVYGVTDLSITREEGLPNPIFSSSFIKWQRADIPKDFKELVIYPEGLKITERLYLKKDGDDWVIYKRIRLKEEKLPSKFEQEK